MTRAVLNALPEERSLILARIERVAGEAFGHADETVSTRAAAFVNGAALAAAGFATAAAATITYLI